MATSLQYAWNPSGSKKTNAAARSFTSSAPPIAQSAGEFRTVTSITRKNGLYCTCGGTVQSVVVEVYDQLIDASTGAVILTSNTASCTCRGTGPSSENIATTSFTGISSANSRKIVAAWRAGVLQIKRTATVKSYTSSNHGTPYFRSGYYDDIITINGTTAAYDPAITIAAFDASSAANLYATTWTNRPFGFTVNTTVSASSNWESATSLYRKLEVTITNLSGGSAPGTVSAATTTSTATSWNVSSTSLTFTRSNGFNRGHRYRVTFTLSVGSSSSDISETASDYMEIDVAVVPIHSSLRGHGVAVGMYSPIDPAKDAAGTDSRFDCNFPAYFHEPVHLIGGIAQIGDGSGNVLSQMGLQFGQTAAQSVSSGGTKDYAITFERAYSAAPVVIPALVGALSGSSAGQLSAVVRSVTETGCTIRVASAVTTYSVAVAWAAFGTLAS